jgi:hypothetical protein
LSQKNDDADRNILVRNVGQSRAVMTIKDIWGFLATRLQRLALTAIGLGPSHRARPPHSRLQDLEQISGRATLVIVAGIGLELVALFYSNREWESERFISIVADVFIFAGLLVEYLVIRETIGASRADRIESDREVANALNRAAEAEAALIEHKTPRRTAMTANNKALLTRRLTPFAGTEFDTGMAGGPGEVMHFCWDLEEVLQNANWRQLAWGVPGGQLTFARNLRPLAGMIMADNVEIQLDPANRTANNVAAMNALIEALRDIGIAATETPYNFANTNVGAIHILIGPKL